MKYDKEQRRIHENHVRRAMVRLTAANESTSLRKIAEWLDINNYHLSIEYVYKIRQSIMRERGTRLDRQLVKEVISMDEDLFSEINREMFKILQNSQSTNGEKIKAAQTITDNRQKLLQMKMDAGVFKRQIGSIAVEDSPARRMIEAILLPNERGKLPKGTRPVLPVLPGSVQDQVVPIPEGDSRETS